MATTPLAQRLYDKTNTDLSEFRAELAEWSLRRVGEGMAYSGSIVDAFWQHCRIHLDQKVAEYFEWIEKESRDLSPSSLRRDSADQCVGAVISYSRQVRRTAAEQNRILQHLETGVDNGRWDGVDEEFIRTRGTRLLDALGVGPGTKWTERLNHLVKDHLWFFSVVSILAFLISLASVAMQMG